MPKILPVLSIPPHRGAIQFDSVLMKGQLGNSWALSPKELHFIP